MSSLSKFAEQFATVFYKSKVLINHLRKSYLLFSTVILFIFTGCVSQKEIERACYQTLSASTPVCMCNSGKNNPKALETAPASIPIQPVAATAVLPLSSTISPPLPSPNPADYIFKADFESGDLSAFTDPAGEYFGKGNFSKESITSNPAIGNFSAALTIGSGPGTAAYLFTYKVPATPLGYYSADFYIPKNIVPGAWWNIWQWKSKNEEFSKPTIDLNILKDKGIFHIYMDYTPGGDPANPTELIIQDKFIEFPVDRWVNITGYYMAANDNSGYVIIYQDGIKIFEERGIQTKPGNEDILWSVNSYADQISPNPATIYVDNVSIAEMY